METTINKQSSISDGGISSPKYLMSLLPAVVSIGGNLLGGYFAITNIVFLFVILVLADIILPTDSSSSTNSDPGLPNGILIAGVLFHTMSIASLLFAIHQHILEGIFIWLAAISTGLTSGLLGINAAHELIHRKEKWLQRLGIWNLLLVNYAHFYTEHRLVHHAKVGTPEDPATARYGESLYTFILRTVPAQWLNALKVDAKLQKKRGKSPYGLGNFTLRMLILQLMIVVVIAFTLGVAIAASYMVQSVVGVLLLEYVNYIEHYGLERSARERVDKHHSWQSDAITSRFTLFELTRHPDHHMLAYKPYHTLESHQESPTLPYGYFGMFYISLIPPLFFKMMHKRIEGLRG